MNKQQLASLIWDTCNDLRGSISAVEYKDIILGFIFYRFVSENEVADLLEQGACGFLPKPHRLPVVLKEIRRVLDTCEAVNG